MEDRRRSTTPSETEAWLARLAAHLAAHRFEVELTADGLVVSAPRAGATSPGTPGRKVLDTIACRPYEADEGRLWFFSSDGEPFEEADHIIDAVVAIRDRLAVAS